jgi:hypothetical protein
MIAGMAIYVPLLCVRGALFGLMPGIAWRSWRMAALGALAGTLAEFVFSFFFLLLFDGGNERQSYSEILVRYLPPYDSYAIQALYLMPNGPRFAFNLVSWSAGLFSVWYLLWPGRKTPSRYGAFMAIAMTAIACTAVWLWMTAPYGPYRRGGTLADDVAVRRFLVFNFPFAFLPAFALVGWALAKLTCVSDEARPE